MSDAPPPPLAPRPRFDWWPVLLEAFFVVMGVVLALAANEWRQHRADARRAHTALEAIGEELEANREAVAQSLAYHFQLDDTLRAFARQASPDAHPDARTFARGFVAPASVLTTAWETAAATDAIGHMPYSRVVQLNRVYEQQRKYEAQAEVVGQIIYQQLFSQGFDQMLRHYRNLNTIVGTFWYRECQLLETYDTALDALGRPPRATLPAPCRYIGQER